MDTNLLAQIIESINKQKNLMFELIPCRSKKYTAEYMCEIGELGVFTLAFTKFFPKQIPDIYVKNAKLDVLHSARNGNLCLVDQSSLLIDVNNPVQLVIDCIDKAIEIINLRPDSKKYQDELQREFFAYWSEKDILSITSILDSECVHCEEYPIVATNSKWLLANSEQEAKIFLHNVLGQSAGQDSHTLQALTIKLRDGSNVPFPFRTHKWSFVRQYIFENSSSATKTRFKKYIKRRVKRKTQIIILILPSKYGDIMFGYLVKFSNRQLMPMASSIVSSIRAIDIIRMDYDYLLSRCSATTTLRNKRVLLLGCGSIGGFVANNLCQMGITELDLLDDDIFLTENVHRHILGFEAYVNKALSYKADLLKHFLEQKYAYVDIDSLSYQERNALAFLSNPHRLSNYDLIISALGEPTINLEINNILLLYNIHTPFIVCFNEPYGIGGHVITTNLSEESCLQCLYTDPDSGELIPFRGSFVMQGQNFKRSLSGCSGSFVPYSVLDSQQTAIYTAKIAIKVLHGQLMHNQVFSWKGDSDVLLNQGYHLSPAFDEEENDNRIINVFNNDKCSCRGERNL